jgi:hypothetical protein
MQPYIERRKSIFYDTDNIAETQTEVLRICDCPGVIRIDTRASNGYHALCIHIPRGGRAAGAERRGWNGSTSGGNYYAVYLQDLDSDIYRVKKVS